jgi:hypothetical protein
MQGAEKESGMVENGPSGGFQKSKENNSKVSQDLQHSFSMLLTRVFLSFVSTENWKEPSVLPR